MKKIIMISLMMLCVVAGRSAAQRVRSSLAPVRLIGDIEYQDPARVSDDMMPQFDVYCRAMHTVTQKTGMYTLVVPGAEKEKLKNLSLLICKRAVPEYEQGATLAGMRIDKAAKCRWYELEREWDDKKKIHYWDIQEKTDFAPDAYIPENAIVLNISGKYVVDVQNSDQKIAGHVVLPRIILKNDVARLQRQSIKSVIAGIDNRINTSEQPLATQTKNDVDIDVAYC